MAKKNTFLDALEKFDVNVVKIEDIQIGQSYSKAKPNDGERGIEIRESKVLGSVTSQKSFNKQNELYDTKLEEKPKRVKISTKIVNKQKKKESNRVGTLFNKNVSLDVSLSFLQAMSYEQKIIYFASNGFWIQLERFKGVYWEVALKYIDKKKYRIYVKELVGIPNYDDYSKVDMLKIDDMKTDERRVYLCKRGWSIKVLRRRNSDYEYATKYVNRKKKHIYIGSYVPGQTQQIFL